MVSVVSSSCDLLILSDFLLRKPLLLLAPPEMHALVIIRWRNTLENWPLHTNTFTLCDRFPQEWQTGPKASSGTKKCQKGMCLDHKPACLWNIKKCSREVPLHHQDHALLHLQQSLARNLPQALEKSNSLWNKVRWTKKGSKLMLSLSNDSHRGNIHVIEWIHTRKDTAQPGIRK